MTTNFELLRRSIIKELDSHRAEIEQGALSWFSLKIILGRGIPRATFQSESEFQLDVADMKIGEANGAWREQNRNGR